LNKAILSKSHWLNNQIKKGSIKKTSIDEPVTVKEYITGDKLLFKGKDYSLIVDNQDTRPKVYIRPDNRIQLIVKPTSDVVAREKMIIAWYRKELKRSAGFYIAKWQPEIGVRVKAFNVRKMKTRWGSCNIQAKRIWLNLFLIKLAPCFLEYVVVHEMVHLLERKHNARFKKYMDHFIPHWKKLKKELNQFSL